jgi:hypothetical protein
MVPGRGIEDKRYGKKKTTTERNNKSNEIRKKRKRGSKTVKYGENLEP